MITDFLRFDYIIECSEVIEAHARMLGDAASTGNESAARAHFECIRLAAKDLDKTLREIERQTEKPKAKEAA
jgi:hypothetical protein